MNQSRRARERINIGSVTSRRSANPKMKSRRAVLVRCNKRKFATPTAKIEKPSSTIVTRARISVAKASS